MKGIASSPLLQTSWSPRTPAPRAHGRSVRFALICLLALLEALLSGCQKRQRAPQDAGDRGGDAAPPTARHQPGTLFGGEVGPDHVGIAVRDLDAARRVYTEVLGFGMPQAGKLANGLQNVNFYFSDGTYIELVTFYDKQKAVWLADFLEKNEGANFLLLCVRSLEETKAFLENRGYNLLPPAAGSIKAAGAPEGTGPLWHTTFFNPPPLPGGRVGFIAYRPDHRDWTLAQIAKARATRRTPHPNGARGIRAFWMVVKDLDAARRAYESVGMPVGRTFDDSRLGARGVEMIAGKGSILLLQPSDPAGKAAAFLARRGESIAGLSLEVLSVDMAAAHLKKTTAREFPRYAGLFGPSMLVPPDLTHDVWIEAFPQ